MAQVLGVRLRTPSPAGPAGRGRGEVGGGDRARARASELLHRPDKPAGVGSPALCATLEQNGNAACGAPTMTYSSLFYLLLAALGAGAENRTLAGKFVLEHPTLLN